MICSRAVSALAVVAASTLVACSSSGGQKVGKPGPSVAPSHDRASSAQVLTQPTDVPTQPPNSVKIRKQAQLSTCTSTNGGWRAGGTVDNAGSKAHTYTITIFFTTNPGGTVQAFGKTKVTAGSGKTEKWTVTSKFKAAKNTSCVLRGVA